MPRKSLEIKKIGSGDFLSTSLSLTGSFSLGKADMDVPLRSENKQFNISIYQYAIAMSSYSAG